MAVSLTSETSWAWIGRVRPFRVPERISVPEGTTLSIGDPASGTEGFRSSHRQARDAHRVAVGSIAGVHQVSDQARALELTRSWAAQHLAFLTVDRWTWVAAAAAWLALFVVCGLWFSSRRSASWIFVLCLAFVIGVGAGFAIYELKNGGESRALAVVTAKEVQARLATADNANSVLVLPAGSEIEILSMRGDWIYAALPSQLRGWVQANTVELVRL